MNNIYTYIVTLPCYCSPLLVCIYIALLISIIQHLITYICILYVYTYRLTQYQCQVEDLQLTLQKQLF